VSFHKRSTDFLSKASNMPQWGYVLTAIQSVF